MHARTAATLLVAALLCLIPASGAAAHSFARETRPAIDATVKRVPKRVAIWFNEPVEAQFARIMVLGRDGRVRAGSPVRIAADGLAVRLPRGLANGPYRVRWRVLSADSHIQSGEFAFALKVKAASRVAGRDAAPAAEPRGAAAATRHPGESGASAPLAEPSTVSEMGSLDARHTRLLSATRGFTMAALLLLVGLITTWALVWRDPRSGLAPPAAVEAAFVARWRRLAAAALAVAVVSTVAGVVLQGAAAAGLALGEAFSADIVQGVLFTAYGKAAVGRIVMLELLAVAAVLWHLLPLAPQGQPSRAVGAAALQQAVSPFKLAVLAGVVAGLVLTLSLVSHAATATPMAWHVGADALHLAAAGAWIGGLVVLLTAGFPATRALEPVERVAVMAPVAVRFSRVAAVSVFLVAVTGTVRGLSTVGSWSALGESAYGRVLVAKLALFAVLLALGAVNHFRTVKRLHAAAAAGGDTTAMRTLRRSITAETVLAAVVVIVTAVLVSLPMAAT